MGYTPPMLILAPGPAGLAVGPSPTVNVTVFRRVISPGYENFFLPIRSLDFYLWQVLGMLLSHSHTVTVPLLRERGAGWTAAATGGALKGAGNRHVNSTFSKAGRSLH